MLCKYCKHIRRMSRVKKKLLTTVLTVGVVLSLVGCGAKETASNENVAETVVEVAEETTEYGAEETTEVVEETTVAEETATEEVVEEQATETTETVEETTVEETVVEEVTTETTDIPEGMPRVFTNDDPETSTVTMEKRDDGMYDFFWQKDDMTVPWVTVCPGYDMFEQCNAMDDYSYYANVMTSEEEKEVIATTFDLGEGALLCGYVYKLGDYTICITVIDIEVMSVEKFQSYVDLIRFE